MNDDAFADAIRAVDGDRLWDAIGRDLQDLAHDADADFIGVSLHYNPDHYAYMRDDLRPDVDLSMCLGIGYRQTGRTADGLRGNAVARAADAYVVFPASASAVTIDTVRRKVADAIDPGVDP